MFAIGQVVNVLYWPEGLPEGWDCAVGDTTVVAVTSRSVTLRNGYKFFHDGRGHAENNAMRIGPARFRHNDLTLSATAYLDQLKAQQADA
jgi:hypothetical protein